MTDSIRMEMPRAWEDAEGWERYYAALSEREKGAVAVDAGAFSAERVRHYAQEMRKLGWREVWVAGCGCSCLGWMFAMCGMNVRVTDVSPTAVAFQQSEEVREAAARLMAGGEVKLNGAEMSALMAKGGGRAVRERVETLRRERAEAVPLPKEVEGQVVAERRDFREPWVEEAFEIVLNIKAMQGFSVESQRAIARTHFRALRPKGTAFFQVQNVQDVAADDLEGALAEAGFLVPGVEANRWRRRVLRETGIPYLMILGRPMIPVTGVYREDPELRKRDVARLQAFDAEYEERLKAERERAKKRAAEDAEVRYVQMIWGTG